jgi:hypothetical protein
MDNPFHLTQRKKEQLNSVVEEWDKCVCEYYDVPAFPKIFLYNISKEATTNGNYKVIIRIYLCDKTYISSFELESSTFADYLIVLIQDKIND